MWPDELSVRGRSEQVAVGIGDSGGGDRRSGPEATVTLVDARCDGVIAVPVAAIVGFGGGRQLDLSIPSKELRRVRCDHTIRP
jgi:hypothetical protein